MSVGEGRSDDSTQISGERTHSGRHGQDKERLSAADPFNVAGYVRHVSGARSSPPQSPPQSPAREAPLRFDDGRLELSLEMAEDAANGGDEDDLRPTSPADSVATEPSTWEPGQGTAMQDPDLSSIEENEEEEIGENGGGEDHQDEDGHQQEEEVANLNDGVNDDDDDIDDGYGFFDSDDYESDNGPDDREAGVGYVEGSERNSVRLARETASARFTLDSGIPYSYDEDTPFSTRPPSATFMSSCQHILGQRDGNPATDTVRSLPREADGAIARPPHLRSFSNIDLPRSSAPDSSSAPSSSSSGNNDKKAVKRKTDGGDDDGQERQKARNRE